jgi:hypothetical protein
MVTPPPPRHSRPYVAEIIIPGLLYIRIDRCPRWLRRAVLAVAAGAVGWLAARHSWLLTR